MSTLRLLQGTLMRLVLSHVDPKLALGIDMEDPKSALHQLHATLEAIMEGAFRRELQVPSPSHLPALSLALTPLLTPSG